MNAKRVTSKDVAVKTDAAIAPPDGAYEQPAEPHPFTPELHLKMQFAVDHFKVLISVGADAHLTFAPKANSAGYFAPNRFVGRGGASVPPHLINLNPDHFVGATDEQVASTLAHELVHLWRHENGPPLKRSYHDKLWSQKMESIGLMPSSTGAPGSKTTGSKMSHYILADGPFAKSFAELQATGWKLDLESAPRPGSTKKKDESKTPFTCPACGQNGWGKPSFGAFCEPCWLATEQLIKMVARDTAPNLARAAE